MRLTKFGVIVVVFIVFLSIFIAKVSNIITVDVSSHSSRNSRKINSSLDNIIIKDSLDHLIWFIQVFLYFSLQMNSLLLMLCWKLFWFSYQEVARDFYWYYCLLKVDLIVFGSYITFLMSLNINCLFRMNFVVFGLVNWKTFHTCYCILNFILR